LSRDESASTYRSLLCSYSDEVQHRDCGGGTGINSSVFGSQLGYSERMITGTGYLSAKYFARVSYQQHLHRVLTINSNRDLLQFTTLLNKDIGIKYSSLHLCKIVLRLHVTRGQSTAARQITSLSPFRK